MEYIPFSERLAELMDEKEVNSIDIEKAVGIPNQTVSKWLAGMHEPTLHYLKILAQYFEVTIDYISGAKDI